MVPLSVKIFNARVLLMHLGFGRMGYRVIFCSFWICGTDAGRVAIL